MVRQGRRAVAGDSGVSDAAGDGGDTTVHCYCYYYGNKWRIIETRIWKVPNVD
jgi:hypothetical protein